MRVVTSVPVLLILLTLFLLAFPFITLAADPSSDLTEMSLEDLMQVNVYSASRFQQKISEAPASVTIITSSEIQKYGYRTLAEILRSVRGLFVTNDRNYSRARDYGAKTIGGSASRKRIPVPRGDRPVRRQHLSGGCAGRTHLRG